VVLPATDNFTGSNGDALDVYSANWTCNDGGSGDDEVEIQSNAAAAADSSSDEGAQHWNADAFNADQYSEATVVSLSAAELIGVACRCASGSTATFYGWYSDSGVSYLFEVSAGAWSQIGTDGTAFGATDVVRIEAEGTTITGKINGGTDKSGTNGNISSGSAGLCAYGPSTSARVDNWEGGNLGAAGGVIGQIAGVVWTSVGQLATVAEASISQVAGVVAN